MKLLLNRLKPYWKQILLIIIVHIIQAVTSLMLPTYTSEMVDTGIQNQGFQYSAPYEITEDNFELLTLFMTDQEEEVFYNNYDYINGNYRINSQVFNNKDSMESLNTIMRQPMAAYGEYNRLDENDQAQVLEILENNSNTAEARLEALPYLDDYPESFIDSLGIQANLNEYTNAGNNTFDIQRSFLFQNGAKMLLLALIAFLAAATAHFTAAKVGTGMGKDLRADIFAKIINFSNNELSKFSTASLITRTTNDIQQIVFILAMFLRAALLTPIIAIGGVVMIFRSRADMAWIVASGVLALFIIITILFIIIIPAMRRVPAELDRLNLVARENLTGVQVIRAFGRQDFEEKRFEKANANMRDTYMFIDRTMSLMIPAMIFIADLMGAMIIWFGGQKMAAGTMQVGDMMSLTAYSMRIFFSFLNVSMMATMLPRSLVSLKRINEVMDTENSINDPEKPIAIEDVHGVLEFNNVCFQFADADEPILKDIDFTARPGETTAIIGSTGSGKSTILNLIMRFIDVTSGSITIDGVDIRDMSQEDLRDLIGYVPQKGVLFSGTIASNIGYGVDDLSKDDMVKAAQIAHAEDFIENKESKYGSRISQGGSNVSGGQKQRLSIARAIAKKPQIYLFDDSFSALDYKTDKSLRAALKENVEDATVIIVAQRISTILDADNILVIENGEIESMGTHEELLQSSEVYREIATSQLSEEELAGGGL